MPNTTPIGGNSKARKPTVDVSMYTNPAQMGSASRPAVAVQEYANQQAMGNKAYTLHDAVLDTVGKKAAPPAPPAPPMNRRPAPAASGGAVRSGGRVGGGGGGGGVNPNAAGQPNALRSGYMYQMAGLLDLLNSPGFKFAPNDPLRGRVNSAVDADLGAANAANDTLVQRLAQIQGTNPYAGLQARSTQVDPNLAGLLQAQGGDTGQYQAQLAALNGQGQQMANNWQNLFASQAANYGQDVNSQNAQAAMARSQNGQEIGAQRNALLAMVDQQDMQRKQALDQQRAQVVQQMLQLLGQTNQQLPADQLVQMPSAQEMGLV